MKAQLKHGDNSLIPHFHFCNYLVTLPGLLVPVRTRTLSAFIQSDGELGDFSTSEHDSSQNCIAAARSLGNRRKERKNTTARMLMLYLILKLSLMILTTSTNIPTSAPTVLGKCGAGKYYTYDYEDIGDDGYIINYYCETCFLNTYCSDGMNFARCAAGKYTVTTGSTTVTDCVSCPSGEEVIGDGLCAACSSGYYFDSVNKYCTSCPQGYISNAGSINATSCIACEKGKYQTITTDDDYYYDDDSTGTTRICSTCPENSYSNTTASTSCTSCSTGKFCNSGATSSANCTGCAIGKYQTNNKLSYYPYTVISSYCTSCTAGTYNSVVGSTSCSSCTGKGYSLAGASSCQSYCPPGSKISGAACIYCSAGYYSDQYNATSCTACSPGSYIAETGAQSAESCVMCPQGKYTKYFGASSCTRSFPNYCGIP